jgi:Kef-type K+ transport system membrane component KefB
MTPPQLAIQFFLQLALIVLFCRMVGMVAKHLGQPQVVAEMIAGVMLGPSLLGLFWPDVSAMLFPKDSMKVLMPVSQLGLALYMFIVGMEFRMDIVQKRFGASVAVSLAGMVVPFALGAGLGWFFHEHTTLFPKATSLSNAAIFLGASMCITAFPMLARIIHFKGLAGTTMGTVAIGAGAIDDAAAWALLAVVLASLSGSFEHAEHRRGLGLRGAHAAGGATTARALGATSDLAW